ncbi:ornithine carbamoyltransferase [Rhodohalobacter mucosus]|uniref:Ornithine carbamoyltransferase n=1 Tax=Rhodohalobacter mucosus TaxID=2079485 RepID=A0A316TTQ3_9BACT|nr:ornithine carbamoyltransferase [Rhodohalobacter mucosus]PWN07977.1 ornithine carbamoyltransferase [Rhodohalobacter mucosus]
MNHLLTIGDLEPGQIQNILDLSDKLHQSPEPVMQGKNIAFVFEKPSLRTRVGTEAAINHLGGRVIEINPDLIFSSSMAVPFTSRESLKDAMMNVSQWCDAIFARVYNHATLKKLAGYGTIPVVNALCDQHHPMQALADLYTLQQKYGKEQSLVISYVGDANNVAFSLIEIGLKFGHTLKFAGPPEYSWNEGQLEYFSFLAAEHGGTFLQTADPVEAVFESDVIYTDTFISMGEEHLFDEKIKHFQPYQVNGALFSKAKSSTGFMHCLPAHRGVEVTDEVIDHPNSWVYSQAQNRMIVSKGVFATILAGETKEIETKGAFEIPLLRGES